MAKREERGDPRASFASPTSIAAADVAARG
jgi:hypothetical protein